MKTMITSAANGVLVDLFVPQAQDYTVVMDASGTALSCYLMWNDLTENHNKFYVS